MIPELTYPFDSELILAKQKKLLRRLKEQGGNLIPKRIAVLGGSTTSDIVKVLELFLLNEQIAPSFYESEYNRFYEDAVFPNEALDIFQPEIVFIHTGIRNIQNFPVITDSPQTIETKLNNEFERFEQVWEALSKRNCIIIQNNFELPSYRLLGNMDSTDRRGRVNFINRMNDRFAEYAAEHPNFFIHDVHYLSAAYGLDRWADPFYWFMYKYALSMDAIPNFAYSLSRIIKSLCGKNKKMIVTDLDNTLWGGVIGDDGIEGITLGSENASGESFLALQSYLKEISSLGVLLAVDSKNEETAALEGLNHPASILKKEDFSKIKANWLPKSENLRQIASELNLLPESAVFLDDNPAEREIIRQWNSEIGIPEFDRIENAIREIDRGGFFEITAISQDDLKRGQMYRENQLRETARNAFVDYNEYLRSLEMKAEIKAFDSLSIPRVTQLINKTNQFNLTTRRYTQAEVEAASETCVTLAGQLTDKFGDNGIVSVIIGEKAENDTLDIALWLMSCRVLKRGMEFAMLDSLVEKCRTIGIRSLRGHYIPTPKNAMVRDLYGELGFSRVKENADKSTIWILDINDYTKYNTLIEVNNGKFSGNL